MREGHARGLQRTRGAIGSVLGSRGFLLGVVLLAISFLVELGRQGGALSEGPILDAGTLYVQLTLPPASLFVFAFAGLLAPPAPFLTGALIGALDAALITVLVRLGPNAVLGDSVLIDATDALGSLWIVAVTIGAIVTGVVAWLVRRFFLRGPGSDGPSTAGDVAVVGRSTLVRIYRGSQQTGAEEAFQADSKVLARYGYVPDSQNWTPGRWGLSSYAVALLLVILLIGIVMLLYTLIAKPPGTLTVRYRLTGPNTQDEHVAGTPGLQAIDEVLRLVGPLDDSPGHDTPRDRFREYLSTGLAGRGSLRSAVQTCLARPGTQYARALQDLVNYMGSEIGYRAEYGRYRDDLDRGGPDGIWRSGQGVVVVELIQADAAAVDVLPDHMGRLRSEGRIMPAEEAIGLYVYATFDSGVKQLFDTVASSVREMNLCFLSVEALLDIAEMKSEGKLGDKEAMAAVWAPIYVAAE